MIKFLLAVLVAVVLSACEYGDREGSFNPVSGPIANEINRHVDTEGCEDPLTTDKIANMIEPIVNSRLRSAGAKADLDIEVSLVNCDPAG